MSQSGVQRNTSKINYHFANRQGIEHDLWQSRLLSFQADAQEAIDRGSIVDAADFMAVFSEQLEDWFSDSGDS